MQRRKSRTEHEHEWEETVSPADGMSEYSCGCGAEKQIVSEDTGDGITTTITIFEPYHLNA